MKQNNLKGTLAHYLCPSVQTIPLTLQSVICGSKGSLESTSIVDPYDGEDLG